MAAQQSSSRSSCLSLSEALAAAADTLGVDVVEASELSPADFYEHYLLPNQPVLVRGGIEGWEARRAWADAASEEGAIDFAGLRASLRARGVLRCQVPTVSAAPSSYEYDASDRREVCLEEYIEAWSSGAASERYMKDWHMNRDARYAAIAAAAAAAAAAGTRTPLSAACDGSGENKGDDGSSSIYRCPDYLSWDWLNEWWDLKSGRRRTTRGNSGGKRRATTTRRRSTAAGGEGGGGEGGGGEAASDKEEKPQHDEPLSPSSSPSATATSASAAKPWDDFRFCYMGPRGSITALHCDVLASYSWSANVAGTKLWFMFPEGEEVKLRERGRESDPDALIPDIRLAATASPAAATAAATAATAASIDDRDHDDRDDRDDRESDLLSSARGSRPSREARRAVQEANRFPHAAGARCVVVRQRPGDVLFVPSQWHHQVFNVTDTISINHNWINACCIERVWAMLKLDLAATRAAIGDLSEAAGGPMPLSEWQDQVELIMRSNSRLGTVELWNMLQHFAHQTLRGMSKGGSGSGTAPAWSFSEQIAKQTLRQIANVLSELEQEPQVAARVEALLGADKDEVGGGQKEGGEEEEGEEEEEEEEEILVASRLIEHAAAA